MRTVFELSFILFSFHWIGTLGGDRREEAVRGRSFLKATPVAAVAGRGAGWLPGRADLWIAGDLRSYSFEFKRALHSATIRNLEGTLSRARADIEVIDSDESHYAAGVVLAYVRDEGRIERYRNFATHRNVDFAYRIGPEGMSGGYLFFSIKG